MERNEVVMSVISKAKKIVIYGVEGIGKTTLASKFPGAVFIDTEGSTAHYDVQRMLYRPASWMEILNMLDNFVNSQKGMEALKQSCGTLIIDTADWAEKLCSAHVCGKAKKDSIEDFGYGKGYTYISEEFGRLLTRLDALVDNGINVGFTAHAAIRKFEQPDDFGSYDRWEMKCSKFVSPMLKEWADIVLFCNYKTFAVAADDNGKKYKAQGGERVMYTTHHPAWDAKNRFGLPEELPMDYSAIAQLFSPAAAPAPTVKPTPAPAPVAPAPETKSEAYVAPQIQTPPASTPTKWEALNRLMSANGVTEQQIREAVAFKGIFPESTPVNNYDENFVNGMLIAQWDGLYGIIKEINEVPFSLTEE